MIKSFTFSNFYSFHEETNVSFLVGQKPKQTNYDVFLENGDRVNKVIATLGANGAGKTQFVKALAFLSWFLGVSYTDNDPDEKIPFSNHLMYSDEPTDFEVVFDLDGTEYKYNLTIKNALVESEYLYVKTSRSYSYVFKRNILPGVTDKTYEVVSKGFDLPKKISEKVRGNSSLISAGRVFDSEIASKISRNFRCNGANVTTLGRSGYSHDRLFEAAEFFNQVPNLLEKLNSALCSFDLGLSFIEIEELENPEDKNDKVFMPIGVHQNGKKEFRLPFFEESNGTQSAFTLLGLLMPALEMGGVALIDEIDNDLHPHLLPHILDMFKSKETNPKNAQLIFSCHTPEVLNLLQKHQIYLVEKHDHESSAWRLDEVVGLRSDDNLYLKYMTGSLEAVPNI